MGRTLRKSLKHFLVFWLCFQAVASAQEPGNNLQTRELTLWIPEIEERFQVKFSFADQDLSGVALSWDPAGNLADFLSAVQGHTGLSVQKLSDRYYSLSLPETVDICGRILDNYREAVSGASIEVLGTSKATVSTSDGEFNLGEVPRKAILKITHLGFRPLFVEATQLSGDTGCSELTLSIRYQELQEVVVYKFLTTGLSKEADGSIRMDPSDFGLLPGLTEPDVLQSIQALPGIKSIDETVSDINIRGGTNDQNLLLWDGIKMYQSGHFFGLISAFNPYLTESVQVIKNGSSAWYGDGLSGIINMQTFDQVERTYFGGGGFNLISADVYTHIPITDRLAFQFSARRSVTDFLNTPTYSQFSDRAFQDTQISSPARDASDRILEREENFYFYDFTGKLLYDLGDRHRIRMNFLYIDNDLSYTETLSADDSQNRSLLDQTNIAFGGRLESDWNTSLTTEISAYHTQYELDSELRTESSGQELFQLNQVNENALKADAYYRFNDLLHWQAGYQLLETGITNTTEVSQPPFQSRIKNLLYSHALFTEWRYQGPEKRLQTRAGLRLNYLYNPGDLSELYLEPRLSLHYRLTDHLGLEVLGELKNQATHQIVDLEQNFLGIEKRRWVLADGENLPVATSLQASLGLHYDRGFWLAGLEAFYKEVDGISTDTQGFQNEDQFDGELGSFRVYGVEALLNYKTPSWSSWLSYAYNRNDYTFEELQPPTFPNNLDIRHTVTLGLNYTYQQLKMGLGLNYRTGRPFTEPLPPPDDIDTSVFPSRINFSEPNSSRLPEYFRLDASMTYSFSISQTVRASLGASVLNLTGRRNVLNTYYRLNDLEQIEKIESISLGLTPNASFRVWF
jgi:hypothetical protein